jgi:electron transport complex, rnfABCDGE type, B subunit
MTEIIWLNVLIVGLIAAAAAVVLYFTAKKFAVENNPLADKIDALLPQANCGACGKAGCRDFANACAAADKKTFAKLYCPVGGRSVMQGVAALLGFSAAEKAETCAVLRCNGTCRNAPDKTVYSGLGNCRVANLISAGSSGCPDGCLRFGDCVKVCRFDALHLDPETGLPVINPDKCTSCGACVNICPRKLFEIRPISQENQQVYVACRNRQKGAAARKNCSAACIACQKCVKICTDITIENNLSYIPDTVSPARFGAELTAACPTGAIVYKKQVKGERHDA